MYQNKKTFLLFFFIAVYVLFFINLFKGIEQINSFSGEVKWHNSGHPIIIRINGVDLTGTKEGNSSYYMAKVNDTVRCFVNEDVLDDDRCSVCNGPKANPWFVRIAWRFFSIDTSKQIKKSASRVDDPSNSVTMLRFSLDSGGVVRPLDAKPKY